MYRVLIDNTGNLSDLQGISKLSNKILKTMPPTLLRDIGQ